MRTTAPSLPGGDPFEVFPVPGWDRYEFIDFIGRGGMGDVFKARDPRLGRFVALKFLRRDDPDQVQRFLREAKVQAKVEHENLCPVYEVGDAMGHSYIAMQYVAGGSIKEIGDLVDLRQKVEIMVDVADALHAAHQAGLIHRDIKPANILVELTPEGAWHPFVVDFGIAREVDTPHELTVSGMILGTPAFCSPEQVRGETSKLDRRTDVYGIGATLYWFLTGQSPYSGAYPEVVTGVAERDPVPPHRIEPTIPVDLETIVLKCLEKEQERRYSTAREVSEDLRRFLNREPITARRASIVYKLNKRIRKHPGVVTAAVIVALSFAALGALSLRTNLRTRRQAAIAQSLTEQAKEIEGFARVSAMMPLHDRTPERSAIRERMAAIEIEMARLGSISDGPGHYALGRGYLTLLDEQNARRHLELAIDRGYSGPGVSYALGMVLGRLYQRELDLARRIENEELRTARIAEIERDLRDPALTHLRSGSDSSVEGAGYAEALIEFYGGDLERGARGHAPGIRGRRVALRGETARGRHPPRDGRRTRPRWRRRWRAQSARRGGRRLRTGRRDRAIRSQRARGRVRPVDPDSRNQKPPRRTGPRGLRPGGLRLRPLVVHRPQIAPACTSACRTSTGGGPIWSTIAAAIRSRSSIKSIAAADRAIELDPESVAALLHQRRRPHRRRPARARER